MGPIEIVVIVAAALIVLAVIGFAVRRKLKGKGGCGCGDCSACRGCAHAKAAAKKHKRP